MGALSPTHWMIVIGVVVLLFGAKRLPDAARSLGRSARILKAEVKDMEGGPDPEPPATRTAAVTAATVPTPGEPTVGATSVAGAERRTAG